MKFVSLALACVCGLLFWLGRSYCKAFHNDMVQVWDVLGELRTAVGELREEKKK